MSAGRITSHKDLRLLLAEAEKAGWQFSKGRKHIKGIHTESRQTITIGQTPGDRKAVEQVKKYLKIRETT